LFPVEKSWMGECAGRGGGPAARYRATRDEFANVHRETDFAMCASRESLEVALAHVVLVNRKVFRP